MKPEGTAPPGGIGVLGRVKLTSRRIVSGGRRKWGGPGAAGSGSRGPREQGRGGPQPLTQVWARRGEGPSRGAGGAGF